MYQQISKDRDEIATKIAGKALSVIDSILNDIQLDVLQKYAAIASVCENTFKVMAAIVFLDPDRTPSGPEPVGERDLQEFVKLMGEIANGSGDSTTD
jgi:hypothetical protein